MTYLTNEQGAVTVDWVILTAGLVGLGMASMVLVSSGVQDTSGDVKDQLGGAIAGFTNVIFEQPNLYTAYTDFQTSGYMETTQDDHGMLVEMYNDPLARANNWVKQVANASDAGLLVRINQRKNHSANHLSLLTLDRDTVDLDALDAAMTEDRTDIATKLSESYGGDAQAYYDDAVLMHGVFHQEYLIATAEADARGLAY